jgi:fluoride exporter
MMGILFVAIGGFFGAICRFFLSKQIQTKNKTAFPLGTLTVNLVGAFLLGLLVGMQIKGPLYSLLGIGFMGAFTTFSTFKLESEQLRKTKNRKILFGYLTISYMMGIILAICGLVIGKTI